MESTGIKGLDIALTGLWKGDNVVWQIGDIADYTAFVIPFVRTAVSGQKKMVYMRFAAHPPLLTEEDGVTVYRLDASSGFESFATAVNTIITREGRGVYYVFDCLSDLLPTWASDLMIGNFFMVTCPYLFELDTVAYFALLRNNHSYRTIAGIRETTQLLIDVYHCDDVCYIHPLKVWNRYSPTMFLPHWKKGDEFVPVTDSANASRLLCHITQTGTADTKRNLDYWDRLFLDAEEMLKESVGPEKQKHMFDDLSRILITKDEKIMALVHKHFSLKDIAAIKSRLIGTGFIGGKAVGMLLARSILSKARSVDWDAVSEAHDSFYIGSDVFYTYIVQNGWWKLRMEQKTDEGYFDVAGILKEKMLHGRFPGDIRERFQQIIEYFGTSPIIVRSSSLLEDGFGNAFAGKYESIFCPNQGTPEERYIRFAEAVRRIYASTMSEDALNYRLQRGLHKRDEQMALLVQRVSGSYHASYFFPDMAGVGVSYNTYVWNEKMDARKGMMRVVAGLGTRAVNRVEGDYARIVALDEPLMKPYREADEVRKFSQHEVDVIDITAKELVPVPVHEIVTVHPRIEKNGIAVKDEHAMKEMHERDGGSREYWLITFDELLSKSKMVDIIKKILYLLEKEYHYPVDIEFTVNFDESSNYKINLLQCRPLQTHGLGKRMLLPSAVPADRILLKSKGYFLGGNVSQPIQRIVYIKPDQYAALTPQEKYTVARTVGRLNKLSRNREKLPTLLMGPGRWGTSTPSLGIPVSFFEINNCAVLGEIAFEGANVMPELSFGTHFFQDLVESNIFYFALFPGKSGVVFNEAWFKHERNLLEQLVPDERKYAEVIGVYEVADRKLRVIADIISQDMLCFSE